MKRHAAIVFSISALQLSSMVGAGHCRTWHVNAGGTGDAPFIRAAVDSASEGDTILVGPGEYLEDTIEITKDLHLLSEQGPQVTTIVMRIFFDYNIHVLALTGLGLDSSVQGFTIAGGRGTPLSMGAGINLVNSSSLIRGDIIFDNAAETGAGISCTGGSPTITGNIIYGNRAAYGCGISVFNSSARIDSNTIAFNGIEHSAPGPGGDLGAIAVKSNLPVTIANNIIAFNEALTTGGIYVEGSTGEIDFGCNFVFGNIPTNYGGALQDQTGLNGNLSLEPCFCAADPDSSGNFLLRSNSPCLPELNPNGPGCGLIGAFGSGCGPESAKSATWGGIKGLYGK